MQCNINTPLFIAIQWGILNWWLLFRERWQPLSVLADSCEQWPSKWTPVARGNHCPAFLFFFFFLFFLTFLCKYFFSILFFNKHFKTASLCVGLSIWFKCEWRSHTSLGTGLQPPVAKKTWIFLDFCEFSSGCWEKLVEKVTPGLSGRCLQTLNNCKVVVNLKSATYTVYSDHLPSK